MAARLDAMTVSTYKDRDGNDKNFFTKIGSAFQTRNGWAITLNALPVAQMGERGLETKILLMEPQEKQASVPSKPSGGYSGGGRNDDPNSEIPFAPETR